jgi:biotin carboxylase
VHGKDRKHALAKMDRALRELVVDGIKTNIDWQKRLINHPVFVNGIFGTSWYGEVEREIENG